MGKSATHKQTEGWVAYFYIYDTFSFSVSSTACSSLTDYLNSQQDVSESACLSYPKLYLPGQKNILFNKKVFALSLLYGTLTSLELFFISRGAFAGGITSDGLDTSSRQFFGTIVAATLVVTVNIEVGAL